MIVRKQDPKNSFLKGTRQRKETFYGGPAKTKSLEVETRKSNAKGRSVNHKSGGCRCRKWEDVSDPGVLGEIHFCWEESGCVRRGLEGIN